MRRSSGRSDRRGTNARNVDTDLEFTGLQPRGAWKDTSYDTVETRYLTKRRSAKAFSCSQFGLATFTFDPAAKRFDVRAYNFNIFPRGKWQEKTDGVFSSQASSLEFLAKNGFSFDKWIREGISYLSPADEEIMRRHLLEKRRKAQKEDTSSNDDVVISDSRDVQFIENAKRRIAAWIEKNRTAAETARSSFLLEPCNSYLRRILRQEIPKHFSHVAIRTRDEDNADQIARGSRWRRVRVVKYANEADMRRASAEEQRSRLDKDAADVRAAVGFRAVIDALRLKKAPNVPLILHNGLLDLLHTIDAFVAPLPDNFVDAAKLAKESFHTLYDTKLLLDTGRQVRGALPPRCSRLEDAADIVLTTTFQRRGRGGESARVPRFVWADGHDRYGGGGDVTSAADGSSGPSSSRADRSRASSLRFHEAGFDAFKTGQVFAGLLYFVAGNVQSRDDLRVALSSDEPSPLARFANRLPLYRMDTSLNLSLPLSCLRGKRKHVLCTSRRGKSRTFVRRVSLTRLRRLSGVTDLPRNVNTRRLTELFSAFEDDESNERTTSSGSPARRGGRPPQIAWCSDKMVLVGMGNEHSAERVMRAWKEAKTPTTSSFSIDMGVRFALGARADGESTKTDESRVDGEEDKLSIGQMEIAPFESYERMCGLDEANKVTGRRFSSERKRPRDREDDETNEDDGMMGAAELKRARSCVVS